MRGKLRIVCSVRNDLPNEQVFERTFPRLQQFTIYMITREEIQKELDEHTKACFHNHGLKIKRHECKLNEPAPIGTKGFSGTVTFDIYETDGKNSLLLAVIVGNNERQFPVVRVAPSFGTIIDYTPNNIPSDLSDVMQGINRVIIDYKEHMSENN